MNAVERHALVLRPGALTTVQDLGRPGLAHLGVPRSGAADRDAHALANRLVGNSAAAASLETTIDGISLRFEDAAEIAVTGALATVRVDGRPASWSLPVPVRAGQTMEVGQAQRGARCYIAFSGGLRASPVLGSMSTDLLSGLGPRALAAGDVLTFGQPAGAPAAVDAAPCVVPAGFPELALHPGPRIDWLSAGGAATVGSGTWTVAADSNRVALRLTGPDVERCRDDELASEGLIAGAIQSLPSGQLLIFLADHPTTGGYPVVAVVDQASMSACAQARPGTRLRFSWLPPLRMPASPVDGAERGSD